MSVAPDDMTELSENAVAALLEFYAEQEKISKDASVNSFIEDWV